MIGSLQQLLTTGLEMFLSIFPDSPFIVLTTMGAQSEFTEWLGFLNWFIPIYSFLAILQAWLLGIAVYYIYQVGLRWLKAIE